jgi:hypothetical protein
VVVVPSGVPSMLTVTVLFASAVPVMTGVVSLVEDPSAGVTTTGAGGGVVSIVKVFVFETGEVLPAASVAVALTVCDPSVKVGAARVQFPEASAVAVVPSGVPSMLTVTVLFASAVPEIVGVVSFVDDPSAGVTTTGAGGAAVSTVNVLVFDTGEVLPAVSVAVAFTACAPSGSGVGVVRVQLPDPSAIVVVPSGVPSMLTVTALFASAVPEIVGVVSFVDDPSAGVTTTGASGGVVSTVNVLVFDTGDVLPAVSVAVAFTVCAPSASGVGAVRVQLPDASAVVVVPSGLPSMLTVTVLFASAVPETVGVLSFVVDPFAGVTTTGAGGGVVSMVNVLVFETGDVLPTASVAVAFTVCEPSARGVGTTSVQFPDPSAVAVVPSGVPSMLTVTVLFASAVPETVGVLSFVVDPFAGVTTTGAGGGVVSIVNGTSAVAGPVVPATVCVALTVCDPSARGVVGVNVQLPEPSAVAVPVCAPLSRETLTVAPATAVPVMAGVVSFVV